MEVLMSSPSSQVLATRTPKQLTRTLLNPQPAGSFCQVGNEKMLSLTRLTAIFEGALPSHTSNAAPPQVEIAHRDTPQRVQITVSPPRVPN
jgi:hypothetical protein